MSWVALEWCQITAAVSNGHLWEENKISYRIVIQKKSKKHATFMALTRSVLHIQQNADKLIILEPGSAFPPLLKHWCLNASLKAKTQPKELHHVFSVPFCTNRSLDKVFQRLLPWYLCLFILSNHFCAGRKPVRRKQEKHRDAPAGIFSSNFWRF